MVDLDSNRYMKDVGPVTVTAKDHEVKPGIQEAMAKGQAPGVNSSFQLDGKQEVTVGADGKGVVTATVVAQKPGQEEKPDPAKGAKPAVAATKGVINNQPAVGVTGAPPVAAVSAAPAAARIGRQPGTALSRQVGTPAPSARPVALAPAAQQGALAVKQDADGPKAKGPKATGPKPETGGQLEVKQVATTIDLKETRREKIIGMLGGAPQGPQQNALAGRHNYTGAKPVMGGSETGPSTFADMAKKGPQIEVPAGAEPSARPDATPQLAAAKAAPKTGPQYAGLITAPNPLRTN